MGFLIFSIIIFLFLMAVVLGNIIPVYKSHRATTDSIINHDATMRKFVYKVNLTSDEIINLLMTKNALDELVCEVDSKKSKIKFLEFGSSRDYYYYIQEYNGFSIIRLEQVALTGQGYIPYKLNPFMINKLQAQIIPFAEYDYKTTC